jgi:hypothetical protein
VFFYTHSTHQSDKVPACFHCPACGERDVSGAAWTERHFTRLLGMVTILEERLHWVSGPCCERQLMSRVVPEALVELDADAIEAQGVLIDRVSPVKIALLIGAFLFCLVPVAGPGFFLLAWLPNGSSRTWFRVACRIWVLLHLVAMNALVVIALMADKR